MFPFSLLLSCVFHAVRGILSHSGTDVNVMWSNNLIFRFSGGRVVRFHQCCTFYDIGVLCVCLV